MEWPLCRLVERRANRMSVVMDRLGVDALTLARRDGGRAYAEARTTCLHCPYAQDCLNWLDEEPPSSGRPVFCPNLELFESCRKTTT
ncbi:DUF6455 family protein [Hyphomicrobium sp.]|uniref:DUF6455 family protein n=1 Tax=Hyphomicrobium sp. TaxID=82 RepID=UPI002BD82BB2|nr:DUF6455 family protein [Hyphomicrobium sp.]HRN87876.1 DUF6455 family protein [Hyphomicrobium sp.]HRQ27200.1 DUF6455 family protein [Hyphomicrobium sp.]